ncbi:MAG TPA: type II toxin-antitoxin system HicB family antitoxin [Candidatus Baltobacteraceae bacterium]|nr:type II toxin-antitoxin system HicB family antitoxin [Candidatus Baltobacteraceae bacterium]
MADVRYTVVLEPGEPDEGGFVVTVPAFPEAVTEADTIEEALANAREVIELCVLSRRDRGEPIPAPDAGYTRVETVSITIPAA